RLRAHPLPPRLPRAARAPPGVRARALVARGGRRVEQRDDADRVPAPPPTRRVRAFRRAIRGAPLAAAGGHSSAPLFVQADPLLGAEMKHGTAGDVRLRRADASDCDAARALIGELGYGGHDRDTFARGFVAALAHAGQAVWVAEHDARVVGLLTISWRP